MNKNPTIQKLNIGHTDPERKNFSKAKICRIQKAIARNIEYAKLLNEGTVELAR